jgi:hypothetical protein
MKTNKARRFNEGGARPDLTELRRKEAVERQAAWDSFTPAQKLAELDRRLGAGKGAEKQRAQLAKLMEVATPNETVSAPTKKKHNAKDKG